MTYVQRKYKRLRPCIESGDIILVRGKSWLPRVIEWADNAYYSHALVVFKVGGRLFAIQSMAAGVCPAFLSTEISANVDFCILKLELPQDVVDRALNVAFNKAENGIPYNFIELPKILLKEKLGITIKNIQGNKRENICSVFAGYTFAAQVVSCYLEAYKKRGYLTPQDLIRYAIPSQIKIIANNPNTNTL